MILKKALQSSQTLITLCFLILNLTACGDQKAQVFKEAPSKKSDLGFIVKTTEIKKDIILNTFPQSSIRTLSSEFGLYEFRGITRHDIESVAPSAKIEKNGFIKTNRIKKTKKETLKFLEKVTKEERTEFLKDCVARPDLRPPATAALEGKDGPLDLPFKVNDTLQFKIIDDSYSVFWAVIPPLGSSLKPSLSDSRLISLTFDMVGPFRVALYFKKNGFCNQIVSEFTATQNTPYTKVNSEDENYVINELEQLEFYHKSVINNDNPLPLFHTEPKDVIVAVIDTGVNYTHHALNSKMWVNEGEVLDGEDTDGNGYVDDVIGYDFIFGDAYPLDDDGHGSHVAGLISGAAIGVSTEHTKIMAIKALGGAHGTDKASLTAAIAYAIKNKANIINLSLGWDDDYAADFQIVEYVIDQARTAGILVVSSAGNGDAKRKGLDNDRVNHYPSSYDLSNIIAVASCTEQGELTPYSNYGLRTVDIAAPGGYSNKEQPLNKKIFSTYLSNPEGFQLQPLEGTSMAAPLVSGVAALLLHEDSSLSPEALIQIMKENVSLSGSLSGKINSAGVLNANAALSFLKESIASPYN